MTNYETRAIDLIWEDDLFSRRPDAELISAYVETSVARQLAQAHPRGLTIAIDAGYGEGKTFFLERLCKHLSHRHPVAFIDAWKDDIADDPLTALAATLKRSLGHLSQSEVGSKLETVLSKTGQILNAAGFGALKKAAGLLITDQGAEAVSSILAGDPNTIERQAQSLQESAETAVGAAATELFRRSAKLVIDQRIAAFEAGRNAVAEMRSSLLELVRALESGHQKPPIVFIVDELDRCRPTYAIKLLEEVKHLFDVPGIVFIFGLHRGQLVHSVAGAYGVNFDGHAYLRRFFSRTLSLTSPNILPLVQKIFIDEGVDQSRLLSPQIMEGGTWREMPADELTAKMLMSLQIGPRDVFEVIDTLNTCLSMSSGRLILPFIVPVIAAKLKSVDLITAQLSWQSEIKFKMYDPEGEAQEVIIQTFVSHFSSLANLSASQLHRRVYSERGGVIPFYVLSNLNELHPLSDYTRLIEKLARITIPSVAAEKSRSA